jgi:hypothetical protein
VKSLIVEMGLQLTFRRVPLRSERHVARTFGVLAARPSAPLQVRRAIGKRVAELAEGSSPFGHLCRGGRPGCSTEPAYRTTLSAGERRDRIERKWRPDSRKTGRLKRPGVHYRGMTPRVSNNVTPEVATTGRCLDANQTESYYY